MAHSLARLGCNKRLVFGASLAVATMAQVSPAADYVAKILRAPGFDDVFLRAASGLSVGGSGRGSSAGYHALLWTGGATVDLQPQGIFNTEVYGMDGGSQVGIGTDPVSGHARAVLWHGARQNMVNLHPTGYEGSYGRDVDGTTQVGEATIGNSEHAVMWQGSAASVVDLHPAGFFWSSARGVDGAVQVGAAGPGPAVPAKPHALMWMGSAASVVDLHPEGFSFSTANDADAGWQVGTGTRSFDTPQQRNEALLWHGSAASVVSLHPMGYVQSSASALAGNYQVGTAITPDFNSHAMVWEGTAASAVDLHPLVAAADSYFQELGYSSRALDVTSDGTIVGYVGDAEALEFAGVIWRRVEVDFNGDQYVDAGDLAMWQAAFGTVSSVPRHAGDGDGDGVVDGADFLLWQSRLGATPARPAALRAAEPASGIIAAVAALTLGMFRSSRAHRRISQFRYVLHHSAAAASPSTSYGAYPSLIRAAAHAPEAS
jgi:hypothetical protein